jgi:DNA polymerase-3 subunit gamma/tau
MGQALYRKYRSRSLSEVVGQEHVTKTLEQALKQGRISHAYLFTGPRGVGKTSIARILAHEINGLPYSDDSSHIDIIEIDAASNRRIDEIRELRDKVYVAPTSAKYKVYIIDEVHMLTREAFNALLKTLEEPPAHVVFILATTDAHKLPETIISRTQRFSFKPGAQSDVVNHLESLAKQEKIKISKDALELIAEHGDGSFRDSVSLLDQAGSSDDKIEVSDIERLLGIPSKSATTGLLELLAEGGDTASLMRQLTDLFGQGYQAAAIAKQLSQQLRSQLIGGSLRMDRQDALAIMDQLVKVPTSHDPERFLEITLLKYAKPSASRPAPKPPAEQPVEAAKPEVEEEVAPAEVETVAEPLKPKTKGSAALDETIWPEVLAGLKRKHNTLYGLVRMAQPDFTEDGLKLTFAFAFHEKRLKESSNRQKIADIIEELTGQKISIDCAVDKDATPPKVSVTEAVSDSEAKGDLSAISNIFGGGELLES